MSCINNDKNIDYFLTYEENKTVYCFTKEQAISMYYKPLNVYTGRPLSDTFYKILCDKLSEDDKNFSYNNNFYNDYVHYITTTCSNTEKDKLTEETVKWLNFYTQGTYMNYHKYFSIPQTVVENLLTYRKCDYPENEFSPVKNKTSAYRGVSINFDNLDYFKNICEQIITNGYYTIESNKPISTSLSKSHAETFSENGLYGFLFDVEFSISDILVDFTTINKGESGLTFYPNEEEIVLLPGKYKAFPFYNDKEILARNYPIFLNIFTNLLLIPALFKNVSVYKEKIWFEVDELVYTIKTKFFKIYFEIRNKSRSKVYKLYLDNNLYEIFHLKDITVPFDNINDFIIFINRNKEVLLHPS